MAGDGGESEMKSLVSDMDGVIGEDGRDDDDDDGRGGGCRITGSSSKMSWPWTVSSKNAGRRSTIMVWLQ